MYKFASSDTILDGVSNIYLISIATAFLAVIVAFYCSNFLKDESEKHLNQTLRETGEDENDTLDDDNEEYLANESTTESELENHYELKQDIQRRLAEDDEEDYDCNSDDEDNEIKGYLKHNYSDRMDSNNDDSDEEETIHVDGLVGKIKTKRVKELEAKLTKDQLEEERRIEREQLAAIFELLKKQEAELNMKEIDENELNAQLSLYR